MKLKTTKVFVPVKIDLPVRLNISEDVIDYFNRDANLYSIDDGSRFIQPNVISLTSKSAWIKGLLIEAEIYQFTKEELISIISDAFDAGRDYEYAVGAYKFPQKTGQEYIDQILND